MNYVQFMSKNNKLSKKKIIFNQILYQFLFHLVLPYINTIMLLLNNYKIFLY